MLLVFTAFHVATTTPTTTTTTTNTTITTTTITKNTTTTTDIGMEENLKWEPILKVLYGFSQHLMNVTDAYHLCQSVGPELQLAILDTTATFTAVKEYMESNVYQNLSFWVSVGKFGDQYMWTNNVTVNQSFWTDGQPASSEDCAALVEVDINGGQERWLDTHDCNNDLAYALCQTITLQETGRPFFVLID